MSEKPSFKEALNFWIKLGFISFGGPAGQIAIMHDYLVDKKKWISNSKFMHALNYCMILPGPEAQQLATYSGWLMHGIWGGLAAGLFFILPSMLILLGLSVIYVSYGNIPFVAAIFDGLKPAIIAIIVLALWRIGKKSLKSTYHYLVATAAFVGIYFYNLPFPIIIVSAFAIALFLKRVIPDFLKESEPSASDEQSDEYNYYINRYSQDKKLNFDLWRTIKYLGIGLMLWIIPISAYYLFGEDFDFWSQLILFFTKAAFVTFGGAYAVLPYVAQVSVEDFGWLSHLQMMDGLALGETTPGPLVMVLVFVGFMAGYHHHSASLATGTMGLLTTTYYTFLPCFLFIFIGAPIIEATQGNKTIKSLLSIVTAAIVGVILNLTIYLSEAVLFRSHGGFDFFNLAWVVVSIMALYKFKIDTILWIGISAVFGVVRMFLF